MNEAILAIARWEMKLDDFIFLHEYDVNSLLEVTVTITCHCVTLLLVFVTATVTFSERIEKRICAATDNTTRLADP
ncbi:unnamed protein product [Camellia sinensis]